ncbi:MAG TPA: hypothetical protein VM013_03210 [Dehalococcoidia bacterium]|nr:hypothetical protein [Dehalococcoidia bacterium]
MGNPRVGRGVRVGGFGVAEGPGVRVRVAVAVGCGVGVRVSIPRRQGRR